jgi:hypothetical protein
MALDSKAQARAQGPRHAPPLHGLCSGINGGAAMRPKPMPGRNEH